MARNKERVAEMDDGSMRNPPSIGIDLAIQDMFEEFVCIAESQKARELAVGVQSGFCGLDLLLGGFRRSELAIVAGAPAIGKSALVSQIALDAANVGVNVVLCDAECRNAAAIATRLLSQATGMERLMLANGQLGESDWTMLVGASNAVSKSQIQLVCGGVTLNDALEAIRELASATGPRERQLVIMDGFMMPPYAGDAPDPAGVAHAVRLLARELGIAVVATMPISGRAVRNARSSASRTADLLDELGRVAEIADVALVLDRCIDDSEADLEGAPFRGVVDVSVVKNRLGRLGSVFLGFEPECLRFTGMSAADA